MFLSKGDKKKSKVSSHLQDQKKINCVANCCLPSDYPIKGSSLQTKQFHFSETLPHYGSQQKNACLKFKETKKENNYVKCCVFRDIGNSGPLSIVVSGAIYTLLISHSISNTFLLHGKFSGPS